MEKIRTALGPDDPSAPASPGNAAFGSSAEQDYEATSGRRTRIAEPLQPYSRDHSCSASRIGVGPFSRIHRSMMNAIGSFKAGMGSAPGVMAAASRRNQSKVASRLEKRPLASPSRNSLRM